MTSITLLNWRLHTTTPSVQCYIQRTQYLSFKHISILSKAMAIPSVMCFLLLLCQALPSTSPHAHVWNAWNMIFWFMTISASGHKKEWERKNRPYSIVWVYDVQWILQDINHKYGSLQFASILSAVCSQSRYNHIYTLCISVITFFSVLSHTSLLSPTDSVLSSLSSQLHYAFHLLFNLIINA